MKDIKEIALELAEKYMTKYKEWCAENPGSIMNGNIMKEDTMKKASFCKNIDEVKAMRVYYDVAFRSSDGPNGFLFSRDAIDELLDELWESYSDTTENTMITDWLEEHGDPEIEKRVEKIIDDITEKNKI